MHGGSFEYAPGYSSHVRADANPHLLEWRIGSDQSKRCEARAGYALGVDVGRLACNEDHLRRVLLAELAAERLVGEDGAEFGRDKQRAVLVCANINEWEFWSLQGDVVFCSDRLIN